MAFDKTPTEWIDNYASDGTNITIPIASIPSLNSTNAHAATGDIRAIALGLMKHLATVYAALPTADQSTIMRLSKTVSGGLNAPVNTLSFTVTGQFTVEHTGYSVAAEPS